MPQMEANALQSAAFAAAPVGLALVDEAGIVDAANRTLTGNWPVSVEADPSTETISTVSVMAGKEDYDATKNLPPDEPAQVLPKGTKTGLPTRRQVERALAKIAKKPG